MKIAKRLWARIRVRIEGWVFRWVQSRLEVQSKRLSIFGLATFTPTTRGVKLFERLRDPSWRQNRLNELLAEESSQLRAFERYQSETLRDAMWISYEIERALQILERQQRLAAIPPGGFIGWLGRTFFTLKTQTRVIEPLIADYQYEINTAIAKGQLTRARFIMVAYALRFIEVTIGKWLVAIARLILFWH